MPCLGMVVLALALSRRRSNAGGAETASITRLLWPLFPVALGTAVWGWGSPAPRFGFIFFAMGYALLLCYWSLRWRADSSSARRATVLVAAIAPLLLVAQTPLEYVVRWKVEGQPPPLRILTRALLAERDGTGGEEQVATSTARAFITRHGLTVWIPQRGNFTGDLPLPATHQPDRDLRLRHPGMLQSGFVIDRE
jgi:hypothetical protein